VGDPSRVGILDHFSAGGVSRFLLALVKHMAALFPQTTFAYFVDEANVRRDGLIEAFLGHGNVEIVPIRSPLPLLPADPPPQRERGRLWAWSVARLKSMPRLHKALLAAFTSVRDVFSPPPPPWYRYRLDPEPLLRLRQCDVVYIGWPYFVKPVDLRVPLVATFHDFHYKVFPEAYEVDRLAVIERQTPQWLRQCATAVTSTQYIRSQLLDYYADSAPDVEVIYIPPYGFEMPDKRSIEATLDRLGITRPYILYSGARSAHKNVASIVRAVGILKGQGVDIQLVITGHGTGVIGAAEGLPLVDPVHLIEDAIREYGLRRGEDFIALGYVANADVDALTAGADAVVSASLYEAGCGPALDAWQAGVPVAMSDIPSFMEQMQRFGVEAWVFDPHDPTDIAAKVRGAVFDRETAQAMAARSRAALATYTWEDAAREYYRVLSEAIDKGASRVRQGSLRAAIGNFLRGDV
jgi:glycosyltransferase involved in cell wall biosynthesis